MASKRKVCVLGLGSMGLGVALALLERQFDVSGFDINKQACKSCLLYTSPSPRDDQTSRMPSSA